MQDQEPAEQWKSRGIVIADGGLAYIDLLTDSVAEVEEHYDPVWAYMQDARNWNGVTRNYYKDEQYQSLLEKAMSVEGYSPESIGAFHDYMKSTATARGVMVQNYYSIWKEGAADIYRSRSGYALPTAFIFSDSWQRVNP
jgi:hypothetical protein